jgi:hypothetical protein
MSGVALGARGRGWEEIPVLLWGPRVGGCDELAHASITAERHCPYQMGWVDL